MTDPIRDARGRFLPGHNYSQGKSRGARNRVGSALLHAIADDFEVHGIDVVQKVREDRPVDYLKICISLLPKDLTLNINPMVEMSDDELHARMLDLDDTLTSHIGGTFDGDGGVGASHEDGAIEHIPALPTPE